MALSVFHGSKNFSQVTLPCFYTIYPQGEFDTESFIVNNMQKDFHRIAVLFFLYTFTYNIFLRESFSLREEKKLFKRREEKRREEKKREEKRRSKLMSMKKYRVYNIYQCSKCRFFKPKQSDPLEQYRLIGECSSEKSPVDIREFGDSLLKSANCRFFKSMFSKKRGAS